MGLNDTPASERLHIGFFGRRNVGKSSLVNAVTGQDIAVVSDVAGTTTDPVYKSMELLPLGPVVIIDTPGFDDEGALGALRVRRTKQVLEKTDIAVLVADMDKGLCRSDRELLRLFRERNINYIIAYNKCDETKRLSDHMEEPGICVSARTGVHIRELKEQIGSLVPDAGMDKRLVGDLLVPGDLVVLVVPIDRAAPKGRLILPQQQVIRDILEAGALSVVVRDTELASALKQMAVRPKLVITDSQVFASVMKIVPEDICLTSFSVLFARYKGQLPSAVSAVKILDGEISDQDKILIAEGCTHHRQCDDIGTVKLPAWIRKYTGSNPSFDFTSGTGFPEDLSKYRLIIHCGGCMLNEREMLYRSRQAEKQGVPMTNYGIAIAHMNGILARSMKAFEKEGNENV